MPTELSHAKDVINELEFINRDLLAEYFEIGKFQAGIDYLENGKKRDFWDLLEKNEKIIDELAKVWIFGNQDVVDILHDILKHYRENENHDFCKIITKLDKKEVFSPTEKAFFILINDIHFFNKCYDMLSIHANNGVVYGIYEGKKDVEITEENTKKLEDTIGDYAHKQYKAGKYCKVDKSEFIDKWIFTINTNKGVTNQPHWEQDEKKKIENEINNEKIIPAVQTNIIYEPKTGSVEIGLFKSRSKTFISSIIEIFGEKILNFKINTTNTPKVYNLKKIQQSIEENGDFYFKNNETKVSITQLSYSKNGIFRVLYRGQHTQTSFLKTVHAEGLLKHNTLEKVEMFAQYKEGAKTKDRQFFIELCKTNLSHNKLDTKIKNILKESGIHEVIASDIKESFKYIISNNGLVNIYKAEKQGYERLAFEHLVENNILCVDGELENLYCDACKTDTMEINEIYATCTNCGSVICLQEVDANCYKLNIQTLKEKLCNYNGFQKDKNSQEPSYLGFLKCGASGMINFHIVDNAEDVKNIKKYGEQIVFYIYGECNAEQGKKLHTYPIIDCLTFGSGKNDICFDKMKVEECVRQYYKAPEYIKKQNISSLKKKISKDCIKIMEAEIPIFLQKPQYKDGGFKQELYIAVQNKIFELHPACKEKSNIFTQNIFNQKWADVIKNTPEYSFLSDKKRRYSKESENQI